MGSLIRLLAVLAAGLVGLSFIAFAVDQSREGSQNQVQAIGGKDSVASKAEILRPAPAPAVERVREREHSAMRERIDDANDVLVAPFAGLIDTSNVWGERLVTGILGLLLYGLGGMLVANFLPKHGREVHDWREAHT